MMECFRCHKTAAVASVTPIGGVVLCEGCVEVVLSKTVSTVPVYFGRCYRDAFRLCLPDCSHLELGPTVDRDGEPRVESGVCNASIQPFERFDQNGGLSVTGYPVTLRRRSTDEYLAALLLTTRSEELQAVAETGLKADEGEEKTGGYREGDE